MIARSTLAPAALALLLGAFSPVAASAGEPFTVSVDPTPGAKVGAPVTARVRVKAAAGYHLNKDFPTSLKLTAPTGVELTKAAFSVKDGGVKLVGEGEAQVEVPFTPREVGAKSFSGTFSFAVCTESSCDPRKVPVTFAVQVK